MKIHSIEITNFKAFLGKYEIKVGGKNLFIYGENGSGKTSLYFALKDFFQSSVEDVDLNELENVFIPAADKGSAAIEITFRRTLRNRNIDKSYTFNSTINDGKTGTDTSIRDANMLKSFLTYKHLMGIHHLKKNEEINLFDLLVNGVLKHFKFPLTHGRELGELFLAVEESVAKATDRVFPINKKKTEVDEAIGAFNIAFGELFKEDSPEYLLRHAKRLLKRFNHHIDLKLRFAQLRPNEDYTSLQDRHVSIECQYAGVKVEKPHLFLNEARLSAIAISIYLGMIKRHIQRIPIKVLFLDDIFIGLDIANRLPLLEILAKDFSAYQIFLTTYDKPWFEYAKGILVENQKEWKALEFYTQLTKKGFEIPCVFDNTDLIRKAEAHLGNSDFKAAAVYTRSAFEKAIRKYCEKKRKKVCFKEKLKDYTTEMFWDEIKGDILPATKTDIERYRALVLNAFSHYNTEKHEIRRELTAAIHAVKTLKTELVSL